MKKTIMDYCLLHQMNTFGPKKFLILMYFAYCVNLMIDSCGRDLVNLSDFFFLPLDCLLERLGRCSSSVSSVSEMADLKSENYLNT